MEYDVNYFINKFEAIPESQFTTHLFQNQDGQKCSVGHCGIFSVHNVTPEGIALKRVFVNLPITAKRSGTLVEEGTFSIFPHKASYINDGLVKEYTQPTPKQRILAALNDVKAMENIKLEEVLEYDHQPSLTLT